MGLLSFLLPVGAALLTFAVSMLGGPSFGWVLLPPVYVASVALSVLTLRRRWPWRGFAWAALVLHGGALLLALLGLALLFSGALGVPKVW